VWSKDKVKARLLTARSPEVDLPPGVDLARLGEIGLRIVGMSPSEARRFAQSIDWHGTVLVPVPMQGGNFRQVEVRGNKALLVTIGGGGDPNRRPDREDGSTLLWAEGDQVFILSGNLSSEDMLEMGRSIR
jgi:hypothetical protein